MRRHAVNQPRQRTPTSLRPFHHPRSPPLTPMPLTGIPDSPRVPRSPARARGSFFVQLCRRLAASPGLSLHEELPKAPYASPQKLNHPRFISGERKASNTCGWTSPAGMTFSLAALLLQTPPPPAPTTGVCTWTPSPRSLLAQAPRPPAGEKSNWCMVCLSTTVTKSTCCPGRWMA